MGEQKAKFNFTVTKKSILMKKIITLSFYAFMFAGFVAMSSCSKAPLVIPYAIDDQEYCLPANPNQAYVTQSFDVFHTDIATAMNAAGVTDIGRATKAGLKAGFKVKVSGSGFTNLNDIGNVEVYMKERGTAGVNGVGQQVAYSDAITNGSTEVLLLLNGVDLKDVVTKDLTFTVKILNATGGNAAGCVKLTDGVIEVSARK